MSLPNSKQNCCGLEYQFHYHCYRIATKFEGGRWYCWQHAPSYRKKRMLEHRKAIDRRNEELRARWDANNARRQLESEAEVNDLSDNDLKIIAKLGGIYAMISKLNDQE